MSLKDGCLYFIPDCSVSFPVKNKYAICISHEYKLWYLVNSCDEKRPYSHELSDVVYIEPIHFKSLYHRSYINIKNIRLLSEGDISKASECGVMSNDLWLKIMSSVQNSRSLQRKYKEQMKNIKKYK